MSELPRLRFWVSAGSRPRAFLPPAGSCNFSQSESFSAAMSRIQRLSLATSTACRSRSTPNNIVAHDARAKPVNGPRLAFRRVKERIAVAIGAFLLFTFGIVLPISRFKDIKRAEQK